MEMETARKTLAFPLFHTYRWEFAVIFITVTHTHILEIYQASSPSLHFMSLLNLHSRVGICRNGNKTHLEKALSFSDFRAQSEHNPVRENGVLFSRAFCSGAWHPHRS